MKCFLRAVTGILLWWIPKKTQKVQHGFEMSILLDLFEVYYSPKCWVNFKCYHRHWSPNPKKPLHQNDFCWGRIYSLLVKSGFWNTGKLHLFDVYGWISSVNGLARIIFWPASAPDDSPLLWQHCTITAGAYFGQFHRVYIFGFLDSRRGLVQIHGCQFQCGSRKAIEGTQEKKKYWRKSKWKWLVLCVLARVSFSAARNAAIFAEMSPFLLLP